MDKKKIKIILLICAPFLFLPIIISGVVLFKYFRMFSGGLSEQQEIWGQFGDLVGGVINPALSFYALIAAIIAIGYQLYEGKRTRAISQYQIFESTFFKLVEIQGKKIEMLDYDGEKGLVAFSLLVKRFNEIFINKIQERFLKDKPAVFHNLIDEWLVVLKLTNYGIDCIKAIQEQPNKNKFEIIKEVLATYDIPAEQSIIANISEASKFTALEEYISEHPFDYFIEDLNNSCDALYQERGNIYGHYFRNMSMLLDHVYSYDATIGNKFAKLFRAQLSRHEIAMLIINCVGSKSSHKFNEQVLHYDLTNGFEDNDIIDGKRLHDYLKKMLQ